MAARHGMEPATEASMNEPLRVFWTALTGSVATLGGDLIKAVVEVVQALMQ